MPLKQNMVSRISMYLNHRNADAQIPEGVAVTAISRESGTSSYSCSAAKYIRFPRAFPQNISISGFFVINRIWSMNLRTYLCMLHSAYAINTVLGNCPSECKCESSNKVQCQGETITEIPSDIPPETIHLFISRTGISALNSNNIELLVSLRYFTLEKSELSTVMPDIFQNNVQLNDLRLMENKLQDLPVQLFRSLRNIQSLFLCGNNISHLPQELFRGLGQLRQLDLSKNTLRVIPEGVFDDLFNLESLSLKDNQIEHLPSNLFSSLENLGALYLSHNNLVHLPEGIFLHVTRLQKLSLFQNRLENLGSSVFGPLLVTELWLYSNNLTRLEDGIFRNLTKLQLLVLSRNSIRSVSAGAFAGLSELREVSLHTNRLVSLEEGTFAHLNNLVNISLRHNQIQSLPRGIFQDLPRLRCVNLHDNSLYNLPTELLNSLQDTEEIVLSQNPWRCDHDIIPFRNWLQAHWSKVPNLTSVVCQTPPNLSRINIAKLTDKDLGRYKRDLSSAMTLIVITLISTSVISITFLCCLFRMKPGQKALPVKL